MILDGTQKFHVPPAYCQSWGTYGVQNFTCQISICGKENAKGIIEGTNEYYTCRDSMLSLIEKTVNGKSELPADKLRLVVLLNSINNKNMVNAIRALHMFEEEAGFSKTLCYKVSPVFGSSMPKGASIISYHVVASRRWMKSSFLASLYILILRSIATCPNLEEDDFKNTETLIKKLVRLANETRQEDVKIRDKDYIIRSSWLWRPLLKNYHEIFGKFTIEKNWSPEFNKVDRGQTTLCYEGIYRLAIGETAARRVLDALVKLGIKK